MEGYKHYIRVDQAGVIVHGFSNAFEEAKQGDIQLSGDLGRHFQLNLLTDQGQYKYKLVSNQMVERTQSELDAEWDARPAPPPSFDDRIKALEDMELERMLGGLV